MREQMPLVSILTPCYNSEQYIGRMLDSILEQTYPNIEVICIDDGSTDGTVDIIKKYQLEFVKREKNLVYICAEHRGQAAAINKGLKKIKGKYFGLLDSDDYLVNDSIEKKVNYLEENLDIAIVSSDYYIVNENDLQKVIGTGNAYNKSFCFQENQFLLLLLGYSSVVPLSYLIRVDAMKVINPKMEINECVEGQNYQLLLPIYYKYKRGYINEKLGYYVIREASHDHMNRSREELRKRFQNLLDMIGEVLDDMQVSEKEKKRYLRLSFFNKKLEEI